jgi:hypothetical protein
MTIKPFAIQGADLTLGGVNLQAGTTTIVIPGVTQATNYKVEEVNETDVNQTYQFAPDSEVVVIDKALYDTIVAQGNVSTFADFTAPTDDDGYIDEIEVNGQGTYSAANADRASLNDMYAYKGTGSASDRPLVPTDWIQIPFRPRMRAGEIEREGGGGGSGGVVERSVEFPQGEEGDTAGTLALNPMGSLFICTADWVDYSDAGGAYGGFETSENFLPGQTGLVSNSVTILLADVPSELLYILQNVNINASDWSVIMDDEEFGGEQTCTEIGFTGGNVSFIWPYRNGTDPNGIPEGSGFTVAYSGEVPQPNIWEQVALGNPLGNLTVELGDHITNNAGGVVLDASVDILLEAGDDIRLTADDQVRIRTRGDTVNIITNYDSPNNGDHVWEFGSNGHLTFPDGSIQVTAYTGTDTGGDDKIWIETFESDSPVTDRVQGATSVEYDADGNIIALFNHYTGTDGPGSYTSVAKLTPTGAILWERRFADALETDGWGLAIDGPGDWIYIAGRISGAPLDHNLATLTKLDGADGTVVWSKTYDFEDDTTSAVVDVDFDGDPVMVGFASTSTDDCIITTKVSAFDGSVVWSRSINGQGNDQAYGMAVGPNSEVVTVGYVDRLRPTDSVATVVAEPTSNVLWTQAVDVDFVSGVSVSLTFNAGVPNIVVVNDLLGGRTIGDTLGTVPGSAMGGVNGVDDLVIKADTLTNDDNDRMVVVKYAADGTIAWQKAIQFDAGFNCSGADADIDVDGNIYVCGQYTIDLNPGTKSAMSLTKFNSSGVKQWNRRVVGACETFSTSVVVGDDDHLYLSGVTETADQSDYIWVVAKYDTNGLVIWQRLIDNTTAWSYGGAFWSSLGAGSNIAVRNGYVALAGGFGDPGPTPPTATIVQIDTDATPFSVGDWDIKGATFSGTLNNTASDITVVDAGKEAASVSLIVNNFNPDTESGPFLTITRYGASTSSSGLETITVPAVPGGSYKGFRASYGRIYNNGDPTELNVSKIVIHKPADVTITIDEFGGDTDNFKVAGVGGSDVLAMFILYGNANGAKSESDLRAFAEAAIDNVILEDGVAGNINSLANMREYFNDPAVVDTLSNAADGLYTNFEFYQSQVDTINGGTTTVREGSGARFDFVIAGDGSITNPVTVADGGTNYLPGHKIKIPYTLISGADANSDIILTVTGATNGVITSVAAGFYGGGAGSPNNYYSAIGTNYNVGSGFVVNNVSTEEGDLFVSTNSDGSNYVVGDVITLLGTNLTNGLSADNDITIVVTGLYNSGSVNGRYVTGVMPKIWRENSISDGGQDQYDTGNRITTNLFEGIDYNDGAIVANGVAAFGAGSSYSFVYQPGIFGLLVTGNSATYISTEGGSGADGESTTDTGHLYYPGSPGATYDNAVRYLNIVNNPTIEFVKRNYGDQVDVLIADDGTGSGVGITRGNNRGIYNPYRESSWNDEVSPSGIGWNIEGWTDLSDITTRTYVNLYAAFGNQENLGNEIVGTECVIYVPDSGKYYALKFSQWTQGNQGGGFAYTRRELDPDEPTRADGIRFSDGTVQTTAYPGTGRIKLSSPGARRIEDVSGYKVVQVTQTGLLTASGNASRAGNSTNMIWVNAVDTNIDNIMVDYLSNPGNYVNNSVEFSLNNTTWYAYANNGITTQGGERGYAIQGTVTYSQNAQIYFRYRLVPVSAVWWDKNDLPSGGNDFRGAVIDYHAYTGDATFIGTIHIVDDDGDENVTHTEVASGSTNSESDVLWLVTNEGTISYQRTDGDSQTARIQWTARVFYGNQTYD